MPYANSQGVQPAESQANRMQARALRKSSVDVLQGIPRRPLMRPLVVKRQITPISGFFAFFRFFLALSSLGNVS